MSDARVRIVALYPSRLGLHADRGNLLILTERGRRRGIDVDLAAVEGDDATALAQDGIDLVYVGSGRDAEVAKCAGHLARHRQVLIDLVATGTAVLGSCGGYPLLGHEVTLGDGEVVAGIGLLDVVTARPDRTRRTGPAVISDLDGALGRLARGRSLVGLEVHHGSTTLGADARALGRVEVGGGNDGEGKVEGAVTTWGSGLVVGTYLQGPLLATNTWLADLLLERAVGRPLPPILDRFGEEAHRRALAAARAYPA